ncbi:hypothetical protein SAMN05192569_10654 [Parageobacillus thermantarcticus]|uniref:Uncharacterized protein n=1 Tax=Parageobacillus thermantarcticus TaxID=186116 RepID=A0A1I0TVC3_9BACL|nr:hypothetical protein [Parageobacillus thermantarcticus]SFA55668.1 hypothetical protein SAMN05192569_10654 [Parageobacillus thermantarcticus]
MSMKYPYRDLGVPFDRNFRNDLNANFDDIEADIKEVQNDLNAKDSAAHARMTQIENDSIERDNDLDARIDNIVANTGSSNTEIVDARYDSINNVTHPTLKDRLDDTSNKIGILSTADDVLFQNDRSIFLEIDKYKKLRFQQGVATITGVNSNGYFRDNEPFVQVTLTGYAQINAPNYAVVIDVISSNGDYGQLIVYDKTQNGFKVKMTGSASSVTFMWTLLNPLVA